MRNGCGKALQEIQPSTKPLGAPCLFRARAIFFGATDESHDRNDQEKIETSHRAVLGIQGYDENIQLYMEPHHAETEEGNMTTRSQPIANTIVNYHLSTDRLYLD